MNKFFSELRDSKVLMGHTRWATQGSVTDKNAHPFIHGHIMLAHNGGISNKHELEGGHKFDVDSEAICHSISKVGAMETIKSLEGPFALTYYDYDTKEFNIIRNDGRPMFMAKNQYSKRWYYASEAGMLAWIADRNKVYINKICELPPSTLCTFNVATGELTENKVVIEPANIYNRDWKGGGGGFLALRGDNTTRDVIREVGEDDDRGDPRCPLPPAFAETVRPSDLRGRTLNPTGTTVVDFRKPDDANPPYGPGLIYLDQWGLALNDIVEVFIYDQKLVSPKSLHMRAEACFMDRESPPLTEMWVYGFKEEEYELIRNSVDNYYTRITQCVWDMNKKKYVISCAGLYDNAPGGHVAHPVKPRFTLATSPPSIVSNQVIEEGIVVEVTEDDSRGSLPFTPDAGEASSPRSNKDLSEEAEKVITIEELDDDQMAILAESMRGYKDTDVVKGPGFRQEITYYRFKQLAKDGCSACTTQLYPLTTEWWGDYPLCIRCFKEREEFDEAAKAI